MSSCLLDLTKEHFISTIAAIQGVANLDHTQLTLTSTVDSNVPITEDDVNAVVTIAPSAGSKYTGSHELTIKAISGHRLVVMIGGKVPALKDDTVDTILTRIDTFFGIRFDQGTVGTINWTSEDEGTLTIASHWALYDSFVIKLTAMLPEIASLVDVTKVGHVRHNMGETGLEGTDGTFPNWSKAGLLWSLDYSDLKDLLNSKEVGSIWTAGEASEIDNLFKSKYAGGVNQGAGYITGMAILAKGKVADAPEHLRDILNHKFSDYIVTESAQTIAGGAIAKHYLYIHYNG